MIKSSKDAIYLQDYWFLKGNKKELKNIKDFLLNNNIIFYTKENNNILITKEGKDYIFNHRFFYINDKLYIVTLELYKKIIQYKKKYSFQKHTYIFDILPSYPNVIDINYFEQIIEYVISEGLRRKYPHYFIENYSSSINYNNKIRLQELQNELKAGKTPSSIDGFSDNCFQIKFWTFRGWTKEEAKEKISEIQKHNAKKWLAMKEIDPQRFKESNSICIEYWLARGYTENEAKIKLQEEYQKRTFTLEKCIKRYGPIEGPKIFENRQRKWQETLHTKPNYIEIVTKRCKHNSYSKVSQELFDRVYNNIKNIIQDLKIYYATLNHEWGMGIKTKDNKIGRGVLYDFVIPDLKYAIEFNGERYHPRKDKLNEEEWNKWKNPFSKITADEAYELDKEKDNALIERGFELDIIWDSDYKHKKEDIIKTITDKILKKYEAYKKILQIDN